MVHDVLLDLDLLAVLVLAPAVPDTEPVEPRGYTLTVLIVVKYNPAVDLHDVLQ